METVNQTLISDNHYLQENLEKNFDALCAVGLEVVVKALIDHKRAGNILPHEVTFTAGGFPNIAFVRQDNDGRLALGQIYFPWLHPNHIEQSFTTWEMNPRGLTVICGIGLGHALAFLLKKAPKEHKFAVLEPELTLLGLALQFHDFSEDIRSTRIQILPNSKEGIRQWFEAWQVDMQVHGLKYVVEPRERTMTEAHRDLISFTQEHISALIGYSCTMITHFRNISLQVLKNWRFIRDGYRLTELGKRTEGMPALIVGGGPSVNQNIEFIRQAQDKAIIISMAQNLALFKKHGLRMDVVCALDFNDSYQECFEGFWDCGLPLVSKYAVNHKCFEKWTGPRYVCPGPRADMIAEVVDDILMAPMNNISHMMFLAAMRLKCDRVILVGHDFAVLEGQQYDETQLTDAKGHVTEPWHNIYSAGKDGGEVPTNVLWQAALRILEDYVKRAKEDMGVRTIDATTYGALIVGTERMTTDQVLADVLADDLVKPRMDDCRVELDPEAVKKVKRRLLRMAKVMRDAHVQSERYDGRKQKWFAKFAKVVHRWEILESYLYDAALAFEKSWQCKGSPDDSDRKLYMDTVRDHLIPLALLLEDVAERL